MKIKLKKYTKINNAKRKSSYIESKLCKKVTIKTTAVKLVSEVNLWQVQVQATGNILASDGRVLFYY